MIHGDKFQNLRRLIFSPLSGGKINPNILEIVIIILGIIKLNE